MSIALWRRVLLLLCALTVFLCITTLLEQMGVGGKPPVYGVWGSYFGASSQPYAIRVLNVNPGGAAAASGLRLGDLIDLRANDLRERFSELGQPLAGIPIHLSIQRGAAHRTVTVVPQPANARANFWVSLVVVAYIWLTLFAAVIAWRRPNVPGNMLLSFVLVLYALGYVASPQGGAIVAPWAWPYVVFALLSPLSLLAIALWARLAGSFGGERLARWHWLETLCYALAAFAAAVDLIGTLGTITLRFDPVPFAFLPAWSVPAIAASAATLIYTVLAVTSSRDVERQRAVWCLVPLAAIFFVNIIYDTVILLQISYADVRLIGFVQSMIILISPVVLTYAALNRRLIDIGFVLNRAAVFSGVSVVIVGLFVLAEWMFSQWLGKSGTTANLVVSAGVALVLGFSIRFIHDRVDLVVDSVFFRKRHEDEQAIRKFAHEAAYITDADTLLQRAGATLQRHADASFVTIAFGDENGRYGEVSENDPALVSLRATHQPLDLHGAETALEGEIAYPMGARGRLAGVLVIGPKRSGESYAPDESSAIAQLAHAVGAAIDVLSLKNDDARDAILNAIRALSEATAALPERIAQRLASSAQ